MARKDMRRRLERIEKQSAPDVEIAVLVAPPADADDATQAAYDALLAQKRAALPAWATLVIVDF